jgi:hypothetical protein
MDEEKMMPVRANQATMWALSADRRLVRLTVPPLRLVDMPEPLTVYMDFDAVTVDAMLEHLPILRSQMLPPLPTPGKGIRPRCPDGLWRHLALHPLLGAAILAHA